MLYIASFAVEFESSKNSVGNFILSVNANSPKEAIKKFKNMIQKRYTLKSFQDHNFVKFIITLTGVVQITNTTNVPVELFSTMYSLPDDMLYIDSLNEYYGKNIISFRIIHNTVVYYNFEEKENDIYGDIEIAA